MFASSSRRRKGRTERRRSLDRHLTTGLEQLEARVLLAADVAQADSEVAEYVRSLRYRDFGKLTAEQVVFLTDAQLASIPNQWWFKKMSGDARGALSEQQVQALRVNRIGLSGLTDAQVDQLTVAQIQSLHYREFKRLDAEQTPHLTGQQLGSIPNLWWFKKVPADARAALSAEQVQALNVAKLGLSGLTADQIQELTIEQIQSLRYREFGRLGPAQAVHLTGQQLATIPNRWWFLKMSAKTRAALTAEQVQALNVAKIGLSGLTADQVGHLSAEQIQSLRYREFGNLGPEQTPHLTAKQLGSIPNRWWFQKMSAEARAALTSEQVQALRVDKLGLGGLTAEQIGWLTVEQIQSLHYREFGLLAPSQVPHLTAKQLGTLPNNWWFLKMSDAARAALTAAQVRALPVHKIGLSGLTDSQVAELTKEQIQSLRYRDFERLSAEQIVLLTGKQVGGIPSSGWLRRIPDTVRAALTDEQVRELNVRKVSIRWLTPRQRLALTVAQIQSLRSADFRYLTAEQVVHLTTAQMASIPNAGHFRAMRDEARAALTRDQLFAMDEAIFTRMMGLPASFAVPEDDHSGHSGPHADDPDKRREHLAVFDLVAHDNASHVTIDSGVWSDPAVWEDGLIPDADADVLVKAGHEVVFDEVIAPPDSLHTLRVDGLLTFDHDDDTQLAVETIVVDGGGTLHIGTDEVPIDGNVTARIVFTAEGEIDTEWDPLQLSRGLIAHGTVEMHGEEVTPYVSLAVDPRRGDTRLVLTDVPTNWEEGDRLILTGTNPNYSRNQDEELEIVSIVGNTVLIDADAEADGVQPLAFHHITPDGDDGRSPDPYNISPDGDLFKVYVANANRNVVLISENPKVNSERGHVMFMHNQNVDVDNAGFYGLGRTDKRNPANDPVFDDDGKLMEETGLNVRGRYAMHFHRAGTNYDDNPGWVTGSVVIDSPGWGFVNHQSYVHMHNNVAFHVVGSGFTSEFGDEIGSFVGNLSINNSGSGDGLESRKDIFDFAHGGHGFWMQGPLVEVRDNIAASSADGAFVFFTQSSETRIDAELLDDPAMAAGRHSVSVGRVPLKSVENNVAFAARRGLETWFHMTHMNDGQSVIAGTQTWNTRGQGMFTPYTGRTTIEDAVLIGNMRRPRGTGIGRNNVTNQMTYDNVTALGWAVGISAPVNRTTVIDGGRFAAVRAIQIDRARDTLREVDIIGDPEFETLSERQLRGREQFDIYMNGGFQMDNFDLETLFTPDITRLGTVRFNNHEVYYHEQAADYVPFKEGEIPVFVPDEVVGKTNTELYSEFGLALAGAIAPDDAVEVDRINGLVGSRTEYREQLKMKSRKYTNELDGYVLQYINTAGDHVVDDTPVDLKEGWNLLTRDVDGERRTFFVFGDVEAPTFALSPKTVLAVNPKGLRFGITIRGTIFDNSFGRKSFKKKFKDLEQREILTRADGSQYMLLEFTIKDLAGNTTTVVLELNLDPNAPIVPGTGQRDLPPRVLPITLEELLQQYIIY